MQLSSNVKFSDPEFGPFPFGINHLDLCMKMPDIARSFLSSIGEHGILRSLHFQFLEFQGTDLIRNLDESVAVLRIRKFFGPSGPGIYLKGSVSFHQQAENEKKKP